MRGWILLYSLQITCEVLRVPPGWKALCEWKLLLLGLVKCVDIIKGCGQISQGGKKFPHQFCSLQSDAYRVLVISWFPSHYSTPFQCSYSFSLSACYLISWKWVLLSSFQCCLDIRHRVLITIFYRCFFSHPWGSELDTSLWLRIYQTDQMWDWLESRPFPLSFSTCSNPWCGQRQWHQRDLLRL